VPQHVHVFDAVRTGTIPATSAVTFSAAFAAPGPRIVRRWSNWSCSPARSAKLRTGANPAHDTRFGSSNTAAYS